MNQSAAPPPQPVRELPIAETISEAYKSVFENFGMWLRIMLGPAILSVPIAVFGQMMIADEQAMLEEQGLEGPEATTAMMSAAWPELLLANLISFVPYVLFAVAWHRFLLLGEKPGSALAPLFPSLRHVRFYLYTLLLVLVIGVAAALVGTVGALVAALLSGAAGANVLQAPLFLLLFMLTLYVTARLQFTFPALAVDEHYGFGDSWRNTRGQGWRFLLALSCCFVPPLFFSLIMTLILGGATSFSILFFVNAFILAAIGLLTTAIVISAISAAFRTCTGWIPPPANQPPANG